MRDSEARGSEMKTVTNEAVNQDAVNALVELTRKGGGYVELKDVDEIMRRFGIGGATHLSVSPADRCVAVSALIECLQAKPSLEGWNETVGEVISRCLPELFDSPQDEHGLSELSFIIFSAALAVEGLHARNEPMPDLTPEQREFYVDLRFRYDAETGKLWISDGLGRPVNTTIQ
jgi:hypothetical protein